jgi:hypothetical protein
MSDVTEVLAAITLGPEDRLLLIVPETTNAAELDMVHDLLPFGLKDRVLFLVASDVQAITIRATKAEGSTVGQCGDQPWPARLKSGFPASLPPPTCHLAACHTGMHSDGEASWTQRPPVNCDHCHDDPPAGHTCPRCGLARMAAEPTP